jgi:energy-coupling factor transport system substrate-specific component
MSSPTPSGKLSVRELCILAFFAALMFSVKTVLASIPNVNLNALLIILVTVCFGWRALYTVGVYILLEGLIFGFSIWWFSYLYIWPLLVVLVMLFRRNESALMWAVLAGIYGLLFGPLMYIGYFAILGGWRGFAAMWIAGIPYDLIHAASNFLTVLVLFKPLSQVMDRFVRDPLHRVQPTAVEKP